MANNVAPGEFKSCPLTPCSLCGGRHCQRRSNIRGGIIMIKFRYVAALVSLLTLPLALGAQETFPNRPIRLVVPWAPGGASDIDMRVLAQLASRYLGQPIVVEN